MGQRRLCIASVLFFVVSCCEAARGGEVRGVISLRGLSPLAALTHSALLPQAGALWGWAEGDEPSGPKTRKEPNHGVRRKPHQHLIPEKVRAELNVSYAGTNNPRQK